MTKMFFGGVYFYEPSGLVTYNGSIGRLWEKWASGPTGNFLIGKVFCKSRSTRMQIVEAFN
jgi:hypothetical protein